MTIHNADLPETPPEKLPEKPDYWEFVEVAKSRLNQQFRQNAVNSSHLALSLNRASDTLIQVSEALIHRPRKLTWAAFRMLFVLWNLGEVEQARLTVLTNSSKATVSNVVSGLIKQGYVEKRSSATDRRTFLLRLTPEGEHEVEQVYLQQNDLFIQWASALDQEEQKTLARLVDKLMSRPGLFG